jgi:hypothetical protein
MFEFTIKSFQQNSLFISTYVIRAYAIYFFLDPALTRIAVRECIYIILIIRIIRSLTQYVSEIGQE